MTMLNIIYERVLSEYTQRGHNLEFPRALPIAILIIFDAPRCLNVKTFRVVMLGSIFSHWKNQRLFALKISENLYNICFPQIPFL
jgi:hypothetical protein